MKKNILALTAISMMLLACSNGNSSPSKDERGPNGGGDIIENGDLQSWQSNLLGQEGHGGDAVVCFNIPIEQAVQKVSSNSSQNGCPEGAGPCSIASRPDSEGQQSGAVWKLTVLGRQNIQSAKPLEQFLAEKISSKKTIIDRLNQMPLDEGYQMILAPFTKLPGAFTRLKKTHQNLGWLHEDGISSEFGLRDIQDSGFVDEADMDQTHCKELQAVVRRDNQLWYDADIVRQFDHAGRVLIQLHEELYTMGKEIDEFNKQAHYFAAHDSSVKTRRLILKLLETNITEQTLNENLKSHGFSVMYWGTIYNIPTPQGYYMDTLSCEAEQMSLRKTVQGFSSGPDFWLDTIQFMSTRYLKDNQSSQPLLRHNFPEKLSNLISYTFDSGNSQNFQQNFMTLLTQFEHPTTCTGDFN